MPVTKNQFEVISFSVRSDCAVCHSPLNKAIIDLPEFPITEIYTRDPVADPVGFVHQKFCVCPHCALGQNAHIIEPGVLYDSENYRFRTAASPPGKGAVDRFVEFVRQVCDGRVFDNIVDIGANDLYLLRSLQNIGRTLIGIDPVSPQDNARPDSVEIINEFFENVDISDKLMGRQNLVLFSHTLEHVSDPVLFFNRLMAQTPDDTLFCFQCPGLEPLLDNLRFDQIFHQHLNYFSLKSIACLLEQSGCELVAFDEYLQHWGSYLIAFQKKKSLAKRSKVFASTRDIDGFEVNARFYLFQKQMDVVRRRIELLSEGGETLYGFGAAYMLPVLNYYLQGALDNLQCVFDDDPLKDGFYYINYRVPIRSSSMMPDLSQGGIILMSVMTTPNIRKILGKILRMNPKHIIVPVPVF